MPATHRNRLVTALSAAPSPATTGPLPIGTAASGYRTFGAGDAGLSFDVSIVDGTSWEIRTGCVYTHAGTSLARGTLEDSSTGSAITLTSAAVVTVTMSAGMGQGLEQELNRGYVLVHNSIGATQSISATTSTKISTAMDIVAEDTFGWWDVANKRFSPNRAGLYLCKGSISLDTPPVGMQMQTSLRKNVTAVRFFGNSVHTAYASQNIACETDAVFYMNGSSDYIELFMYHSAATALSTSKDIAQRVLFSATYLGNKTS